MDLTVQCICGHVVEEHEPGPLFQPCELCDCDDYEGVYEDDE